MTAVARQNFEKIIRETIKPLGAEEAEVISVDVPNFTLRATGQRTGRNYFDVKFVALPGDMNNGIIPIPEIGTVVLIVQMDRNDSFVAVSGKLSQLLLTAPTIESHFTDSLKITDNADMLMEVLPNGVKIQVGSNSYKEGLAEFKAAFQAMTVMTSQGASSTPINIANIVAALDKMLACLQ